MKAHLDRIADGIIRPINPYATIFIGVLTFLWGLWIVSPFWSVFETGELWSSVAAFAPEVAWGSWSVICGVMIVYSVLKGRFRYLKNSLAFCAWHWGTISILLWTGDWKNTGGLTYGFICLITAYCYINIKMNYVDNHTPPPDEPMF